MSIIGNAITPGGGGGGSGAVKVMTQGQVSRVSAYMTATFDSSIAEYGFVEVHLFYNGADVGLNVCLVPASSTTFFIKALSDTFYFSLTPTTISITSYSTAWKALYVDVYAYHKAA